MVNPMKALQIAIALVALILMISGAFAYQGFNSYYYTDNYYQSVYAPSPAYHGYVKPAYTYNASYYYGAPAVVYPAYAYTTYYPTYVPTYYATSYYPRTYSGMSIYSSGDSWGISIGRGSICGYYGYC